MTSSTIPYCCPVYVGDVLVCEFEGTANIVSSFPHLWEITVEEAGTRRTVSLDNIKPTDSQADLKAGLRKMVEDHLCAMPDAVDAALRAYHQGTAYRQRADQHAAE